MDLSVSPPVENHGPLASRDDLVELRRRFAETGRVVVGNILADAYAQALRAELLAWPRWALVARIDGRHYDFDVAEFERLPVARRAELDALILAEAGRGMQYRYERHPLYDLDYDAGPLPPALAGFRELLQRGAFLALARAITGQAAIAFGDGQMTRYRRGHFLTRHDDAHPTKRRVAAYVLGLTPDWGADQGGQLQFLDEAGRVEDTVVPGFNTLTLFRVPRPHLVGAVAPFVETSRLSVTGWLREA